MRWSWPSWNCRVDFPVVFHCWRAHRHTGPLQHCLPPTIWSWWLVCHLVSSHPLPTAMLLQKELGCSPLVGIQGDLFVRIWRDARRTDCSGRMCCFLFWTCFLSFSVQQIAFLRLSEGGFFTIKTRQDQLVVPREIWIAFWHCHLCLCVVCLHKWTPEGVLKRSVKWIRESRFQWK